MMPFRNRLIAVFTGSFLIASLAIGQQGKPFTADRHKMECNACHGDGKKEPVDSSQCLTCHKSFSEVAKGTQDLTPNPHENHFTKSEAECTQCHHGHKPNDVICKRCHVDMVFEHRPVLSPPPGKP